MGSDICTLWLCQNFRSIMVSRKPKLRVWNSSPININGISAWKGAELLLCYYFQKIKNNMRIIISWLLEHVLFLKARNKPRNKKLSRDLGRTDLVHFTFPRKNELCWYNIWKYLSDLFFKLSNRLPMFPTNFASL